MSYVVMHVFKTSKINQYFHIAQLCVSASEQPGTYSRIYSVLITDGLGVKKKRQEIESVLEF